jgi:hypothetical protein
MTLLFNEIYEIWYKTIVITCKGTLPLCSRSPELTPVLPFGVTPVLPLELPPTPPLIYFSTPDLIPIILVY